VAEYSNGAIRHITAADIQTLVAANGKIYWLNDAGTVAEYSNGAIRHITAADVQALTLADGLLFALKRNASLEQYTNGSWTVIERDVASFEAEHGNLWLTTNHGRNIWRPTHPDSLAARDIGDEFFEPVAHVTVERGALDGLGSATFIHYGGQVWVVTARHVLLSRWQTLEEKSTDFFGRNIPLARPDLISVEFLAGNLMNPHHKCTIVQIIEHPKYDVALMRLSESPFDIQGIEPALLPVSGRAGVGSSLVQLGYGATTPGGVLGTLNAGISRVDNVLLNITNGLKELIYENDARESFPLPGDSGGPDFVAEWATNIVTRTRSKYPVIAGVHSWTDANGRHHSIAITFALAEWMRKEIDPSYRGFEEDPWGAF
jgi:hypothetical protein